MASQLLSNPVVPKLIMQGYAIKKTLSNYGKPTVTKDEKGQAKVEGEDTDEAVFAVGLYAIYLVSAVGFVLGGIAMFFNAALLVDFASLCLLVLAPTVAVQKVRLNKLKDLRGQHNMLREKCNVLAGENDKLTGTINEMETQVNRLAEVEEGLSKYAKESGTQVDRLVEIVKENGELQQQVKQALERQVMQQIVDAVVKSDRDRDFTLTTQETNMLKMRLSQMKGVQFSTRNFDDMIASDENELTLQDVMKIVRNLLDDEVPKEDNVFLLDPESLTQNKGGMRSLLPF